MPPKKERTTRPPAEDALELARRLLATELGPEQRLLAEGIRDAASAMLARPSRAALGPTRRKAVAPDTAAAPDGQGRPMRGRGRILVVDDSESNRLLALLQLDRLGFDAVAVDDGWAALERLAEESFDLVLLDGMMPGLDGPGTAREIRRRESSAGLQRMPIVALTASILPEDRELVLEAGMDDHLSKPIRIEELARVLDLRLAEAPFQRGRLLPAPSGTTAHAARRAGDFQILRSDWIGDYVDPATFLDIFRSDSGNNYTGWSSPEYDAALFASARTVDPEARLALFQKAEALLVEAAPIIPLYHYTHVFLLQPSVKGWHPTLLDHHPYKHVWLEN